MIGDTPEWYGDAPCLGNDNLFFSSHPSKRRMAVSVCESKCSFKQECLGFAVKHGVSIGVWGGKTGPDLARILESAVEVH